MKTGNTLFFAALSGLLGFADGALGGALPAPEALNSLATVEFSPIGVVPFVKNLFFVFPKSEMYLKTSWNEEGKTQIQRFGELLSQKRFPIKAPPLGSRWVGGWIAKGQLVWLDGRELNTVAIGVDDGEEKTYRSVPWEGVLLPPRDRGGEAGRPEIEKMRAKFKKEFVATPLRIVGVAALESSSPEEVGTSKSLKRRTSFSLAVLTRLPSHPLGIIACQVADPSQCVWERSCRLPPSRHGPADYVGIAFDLDERLLLIGSLRERKLLVFKFNSCLSIVSHGSIGLPEKIKELTAMAIDESGHLFLATAAPDDYQNGSVFTWEPSIWQAAIGRPKGSSIAVPKTKSLPQR